MSDLARPLRDKLALCACIEAPRIVGDTAAQDGTRKWLLKVDGSNAVEAVFIPESRRGTLCVSSQAGCVLDCAFCSTGKQGFNRNLGTAEIIGQLWLANRLLEGERPVTNVVMMGMGEPLLNLDNVIPALRLMLDDNAYGLSRRRVTVSTAGVIPGMDRLRDECPVALALSLHAPNDALRDQLVPVNRKYPLRELLAACNRYLEKAPRDFITLEYVMLEGVNAADAHTRELVRVASRATAPRSIPSARPSITAAATWASRSRSCASPPPPTRAMRRRRACSAWCTWTCARTSSPSRASSARCACRRTTLTSITTTACSCARRSAKARRSPISCRPSATRCTRHRGSPTRRPASARCAPIISRTPRSSSSARCAWIQTSRSRC